MSEKNRKCFSESATDSSKELVKRFYYALKMEKAFHKFQKDFLPLTGMRRTEEDRIRNRVYHRGDAILINDGVWYRPVLPSDFSSDVAPKPIQEASMLRAMITPIFFSRVMTKHKAVSFYLKHYFLTFGRKRHIKQTDMCFEFLFGIVGMLLFAVISLICVSLIASKGIALVFGATLSIVTMFIILLIMPSR
jgi:hypothetical protein